MSRNDAAAQAALNFLYGRLNYERVGMPRRRGELRLTMMRQLLGRLGNPHHRLRVVHVAGTKGKGSTAAMIAEVLAASGRRVGLFCSPHLHRIEERYRINGQEIDPGELVDLIEAVRPAVEGIDAESAEAGLRVPTFFEVSTALGLMHFARSRVDVAVVEVGMGGRLDSTNVVRPLVSVITSISFDHTRQLGNTLAAIAGEKAGILKRGRPAVSAVAAPEAREVIRAVAARRRCRLIEVDEAYPHRYVAPAQPIERPEAGALEIERPGHPAHRFALGLHGPHQARNAATAIAVFDLLATQGLPVTDEAIERGLARVRFPARFEVFEERPWIILDGAHNVASARALAETLRLCAPALPRTLIFGTTREKDLTGQLEAMAPLFETLIATRYLENPRAVLPVEIAAEWQRLTGREARLEPGPAEALAAARGITPEQGLVCVTGSLFLTAEVRARLLGLPAPPLADIPAR